MVAFIVASWYGYVRAQSDARWGWMAASLRAPRLLHQGFRGVLRRGAGTRRRPGGRGTSCRPMRPHARRAGRITILRARRLRRHRAAAVRAAALDRLPLLQLADVGDAQAELRPALAASTASRGSRSTTTSSRACGSPWSSASRRALGIAGQAADRQCTGERLLALWLARGDRGADPSRRRQRAAVRDFHPGARRACGARARRATASSCLRRRPPCHGARPCWRRRCCSSALYVAVGIARPGHDICTRSGPNVRLGGGAGGAAGDRPSTRPGRGSRGVLGRGAWTPRAGTGASRLVGLPGSSRSSCNGRRRAATRTTRPRSSSAGALPPGTLVHGKLANGLSLENRIRPMFIGRGFGNYADRKTRDDVRYILTYVAPSLGYESQAGNPSFSTCSTPTRTIASS